MRAALLIGLIVAVAAGAAQAQNSPYRNPYGMGPAKDPYDLPKALQGNPYDRDYTKQDHYKTNPSTYDNRPGNTQRNSGSSYGANPYSNPFGQGSSLPSSRNRQTGGACNRPGVVC